MQETVAGMPEPLSTTLSLAAAPVAVRFAPAGLTEFAQPVPAAACVAPAQGVVWSVKVPWPAQKGSNVGGVPTVNRAQNTLKAPFVVAVTGIVVTPSEIVKSTSVTPVAEFVFVMIPGQSCSVSVRKSS